MKKTFLRVIWLPTIVVALALMGCAQTCPRMHGRALDSACSHGKTCCAVHAGHGQMQGACCSKAAPQASCGSMAPACDKAQTGCKGMSPACSQAQAGCKGMNPACSQAQAGCKGMNPACSQAQAGCKGMSPACDRASISSCKKDCCSRPTSLVEWGRRLFAHHRHGHPCCCCCTSQSRCGAMLGCGQMPLGRAGCGQAVPGAPGCGSQMMKGQGPCGKAVGRTPCAAPAAAPQTSPARHCEGTR